MLRFLGVEAGGMCAGVSAGVVWLLSDAAEGLDALDILGRCVIRINPFRLFGYTIAPLVVSPSGAAVHAWRHTSKTPLQKPLAGLGQAA